MAFQNKRRTVLKKSLASEEQPGTTTLCVFCFLISSIGAKKFGKIIHTRTHNALKPLLKVGYQHFLDYNAFVVSPSSSGQDTALSRRKRGFDSRWGYQGRRCMNVFQDYSAISGPLHAMHRCRMALWLREARHFIKQKSSPLPLAGQRVLDLGCGDGLAAHTCALLGASVIAVDSSDDALKHAKQHKNIMYHKTTAQNFLEKNTQLFSFILCLEVLEHWHAWEQSLHLIVKSLEPTGLLTFSTINKTTASFLKAIVWTEYVAHWLPRHTHDWSHFIKPSEIIQKAEPFNLRPHAIRGMSFLPISKAWVASSHTNTNYLLFLRKNTVY